MGLGKYALILGCVVLAFLIVYNLILNKIRYLEIQSYKRKCLDHYFPTPLTSPMFATDRFDENLAKYLLTLSLNVELSNCSQKLGPLPNVPGFAKRELIGTVLGRKRMLGYVFASNKAIIIVFTGTVFVDEWTEDAEVTQVPISKLGGRTTGDKAHKGFYDMYCSIRDQLLDIVKENHMENSQTVYITGHSLGGALATLAAYDLVNFVPRVYTFAAPRVFNITGAKRYDQIITYSYRVHNTEDIFTSLPLPVIFGVEYEHTGNGGIPFTNNLGSMAANHTDAYVDAILK